VAEEKRGERGEVERGERASALRAGVSFVWALAEGLGGWPYYTYTPVVKVWFQ